MKDLCLPFSYWELCSALSLIFTHDGQNKECIKFEVFGLKEKLKIVTCVYRNQFRIWLLKGSL
jgi:hypothetical protein